MEAILELPSSRKSLSTGINGKLPQLLPVPSMIQQCSPNSPPHQVKSYISQRKIYRVTNLIYMPHYSASLGQDKFLFTGVHEADLPRMHIPMGEIS